MTDEEMAAVKTDYEQTKSRRAELTAMSLQVSESQQPTPTQEENDLAALGLLDPDDKAVPAAPEMPPLGMQQAYLANVPGAAAPKIVNPVEPAPTAPARTTSTTTTAPRTTTSSGTVSSTGTASSG
jgi:hypothetical protein